MALDKNDIINYINYFERIHDVEIVRIHPDSNQINTYHGFHESKLSPEVINKLSTGEYISNNELLSGDNRKRVIVVNIDNITAMNFPNEYYLNMILLHELGHVKTLDTFPNTIVISDIIKQGLLTRLVSLLFELEEIDKTQLAANQHYVHHQFSIEKVANTYFDIDTKAYYDDYYGCQPDGIIPCIDWKKLVDIEIENKFIQLYEKRFDMTEDERFEFMEYLLTIANEIIIDDNKRYFLLENF